MDIYRKKIQLRSADVDSHRRLRLSTLFAFLEEAAITHTELLGAGRDKTLDCGLLWVVTQQYAKIYRMPEYEEKLTLESWPEKTMHLFFPRCARLLDASGQVLVEATAYWVLMDQTTRRVIFPEEHGIAIDAAANVPTITPPRRIRAEVTTGTASFTVPYSYLDLNGHMNNARYFDLALDYLPSDAHERALTEISVEYIGEARLGDHLQLHYCGDSSHYYLSAEKDQPVFRMKLCY